MIVAIISGVLMIVEALLGFRFAFMLLGANPTNPFVTWVYSASAPLVAPFAGILGASPTTQGAVVTSVFDLSTLVALVVFAIIGGVVIRLLAPHRSAA